MPKVSVIVTTYNRKEYLTETIQSILNQTYQDFELIVVDNYSNYDFKALIESFHSDKITAFQNYNNGIIAVNRNIGISHAKGEYVAFCDDDDIWIYSKLEIQLNKITTCRADLVSSNLFIFEGSIENIKIRTENRKLKGLNDLLLLNQVYTSTVVTKNSKELFFPEDIQLLAIEDYGLWINLMNFGYKFEFIDEALVYYRKAPNSAHVENYINKHIKFIYLYSNFLKQSNKPIQKLWLILLIAIQIIKYVGKNVLSYIDKKWHSNIFNI